MIDPRFHAFEAVVKAGSFDRAARSLNVTQSAVSQRISQLEADLGQILLVRSKPVQPTPAGRRLLPYLAQMRLLQTEASHALNPEASGDRTRLALGVNADSLATWFLPAVAPVVERDGVVIDCVLDDQDHTHALLANGEVLGCVSTRADPVRGCDAIPLGTMRYRCVGTAAFRRLHFPRGLTRKALSRAPAIVFGRNDDMHEEFLLRHFGLDAGQYPLHVLPSSEGFLALARMGLGYGFVPELQADSELETGALVDLTPERFEDVSLYWHHWAVQSPVMARLCSAIRDGARAVLRSSL